MGKWPFHPVVEKSPFGAITSMILVTSFFPLLRLLTQKDLRKVCREIFEMADEAISNFFVQPCLRGGSSKTVYLANYWLSTLVGFFFGKEATWPENSSTFQNFDVQIHLDFSPTLAALAHPFLWSSDRMTIKLWVPSSLRTPFGLGTLL